jgi:hypothetical protein
MSDPRNQFRQQEKVLDPEARPPAPKTHVGIWRGHVGPTHWHAAARAIGQSQSNQRFAVKFLGYEKRKCAAAEWVKRVNYPNTAIS